MDIQLGAPGQIIPPVDRGVALGIKMEKLGYDALWWPDHLMGWHPDTMWNEDFTPLAKHQPSSHVHVDPFAMMAAIGAQSCWHQRAPRLSPAPKAAGESPQTPQGSGSHGDWGHDFAALLR